MSDIKPCPLEPTLTITIHKELIKLCGNRSTAIEDALRVEVERLNAEREAIKAICAHDRFGYEESESLQWNIELLIDVLNEDFDAANRRIAELEAEVRRLTPKPKQINKPSTWTCTGDPPLVQFYGARTDE